MATSITITTPITMVEVMALLNYHANRLQGLSNVAPEDVTATTVTECQQSVTAITRLLNAANLLLTTE